MSNSQQTLVEILKGKTPEAMYDELHARRCLTAQALRYPVEVIEFMKDFLRSHRQWCSTPPNQVERLVKMLVGSDFLNEEGRKLFKEGASCD
jgi:hypothetical protein